MWCQPAEETEGYPGFVVHDGRVTGSITAGATRLPLWAFIPQVVLHGWEAGASDYDPDTPATVAAGFLYDLLEARGEFGRLLLTIADVQRIEGVREEAEGEQHWRDHHEPGETVCDCGGPFPPPWWEQDDLRDRVAEQLRRCLDVLGKEAA